MSRSSPHLISRREALRMAVCAAFAANPSLHAKDSTSHTTLEEIFDAPDLTSLKFAKDIFEQCILGRIRPAEPPFVHSWLIPGGLYVGQWLWDTTFITRLLALLPGKRSLIRGVYQNFWDAQIRWDAVQPSYMRGMIPNFIAPDSGPPGFSGKNWKTFPAYSQAPLLAWGIEEVFKVNGDEALVRDAIRPLEAFHEWYWRERDIDNCGLLTVGSYDSSLRSARFETYDYEADLDQLQLVAHPKHPTEGGACYGDLYIPANTAYLLLSEGSLARLARICGDYAMAKRRTARLGRGIEAMRSLMWDESHGCFLAVRRGDYHKESVATVGGIVPLTAKVPTSRQARRMRDVLTSDDWNTPLPVPTVQRSANEFKEDGFWRGDAWPVPAYQVSAGLHAYGYRSESSFIANKWIENAMHVGVSEHYDSLTGAPLGVKNLGMSSVILSMMLDGLSRSHWLRLRRGKSS